AMWHCLPGGQPSPTSTLATRTRFPLCPDPTVRWGTCWLRVRPGVPLAAAGEDLAEGHGLVGHDAVHAQVEEAIHGRAVVHRPGMDLQAEGMGAGDERWRGHRGRHLDTADPAAGEPV